VRSTLYRTKVVLRLKVAKVSNVGGTSKAVEWLKKLVTMSHHQKDPNQQ
jgi:hypothetical protein